MTEILHAEELLGQVLGVVHQDVDTVRESERVLVPLSEAVGARPQQAWAVIGQVGNRSSTPRDPVSVRPPASVRDLESQDLEALHLGQTPARLSNRQPASSSAGRIGKWGGDIALASSASASGPRSGRSTRTRLPP
ncbi:MAG: hypothetical protein M3R66_06465 [Actinomycetota bacterium]|nr:hypothetical protein [Actinomycetota bacterium]